MDKRILDMTCHFEKISSEGHHLVDFLINDFYSHLDQENRLSSRKSRPFFLCSCGYRTPESCIYSDTAFLSFYFHLHITHRELQNRLDSYIRNAFLRSSNEK